MSELRRLLMTEERRNRTTRANDEAICATQNQDRWNRFRAEFNAISSELSGLDDLVVEVHTQDSVPRLGVIYFIDLIEPLPENPPPVPLVAMTGLGLVVSSGPRTYKQPLMLFGLTWLTHFYEMHKQYTDTAACWHRLDGGSASLFPTGSVIVGIRDFFRKHVRIVELDDVVVETPPVNNTSTRRLEM